jgi:thiol:disulfide interchange protein DsbA
MNARLATTLLALVVSLTALGACARDGAAEADAANAGSGADAAGSAVEPAAPAASPAPAGSAAAAGSAAMQEGATATALADDEPASKGDRALERLTQLPAQDQLPGGKWQVGKHYTALVPAQPTSVGPGRVEVVEVFWYGCGHCYQLEPFLESWQKNKAAYIDFVRVPVTWSPQHKGHARLYYTLQALKRDDLHTKVFDAIHRGGRMLVGNDDASTLKEQVAWAKSQGIDEAAFTKEWNGFTVTTALQRAEQLIRRYRVEGVPFVVVNGKYTTDVGAAGGQSQLVALINDLAAAEKRR